jgi:NAD-dependent deacetylase
VIKEVFYSYFDSARPNAAHIVLAELERTGIVSAVVTQNIDGLHQAAGSQRVIEFHGSSTSLSCLECGKRFSKDDVDFSASIPSCSDCHGVLKPDFVFFGEGIPPRAYGESIVEAETCDVVLIVGTTGEVMPACSIPRLAKNRGASVIEVNTEKTRFTEEITDVFLEGQASVTLEGLAHRVSALKGI